MYTYPWTRQDIQTVLQYIPWQEYSYFFSYVLNTSPDRRHDDLKRYACSIIEGLAKEEPEFDPAVHSIIEYNSSNIHQLSHNLMSIMRKYKEEFHRYLPPEDNTTHRPSYGLNWVLPQHPHPLWLPSRSINGSPWNFVKPEMIRTTFELDRFDIEAVLAFADLVYQAKLGERERRRGPDIVKNWDLFENTLTCSVTPHIDLQALPLLLFAVQDLTSKNEYKITFRPSSIFNFGEPLNNNSDLGYIFLELGKSLTQTDNRYRATSVRSIPIPVNMLGSRNMLPTGTLGYHRLLIMALDYIAVFSLTSRNRLNIECQNNIVDLIIEKHTSDLAKDLYSDERYMETLLAASDKYHVAVTDEQYQTEGLVPSVDGLVWAKDTGLTKSGIWEDAPQGLISCEAINNGPNNIRPCLHTYRRCLNSVEDETNFLLGKKYRLKSLVDQEIVRLIAKIEDKLYNTAFNLARGLESEKLSETLTICESFYREWSGVSDILFAAFAKSNSEQKGYSKLLSPFALCHYAGKPERHQTFSPMWTYVLQKLRAAGQAAGQAAAQPEILPNNIRGQRA